MGAFRSFVRSFFDDYVLRSSRRFLRFFFSSVRPLAFFLVGTRAHRPRLPLTFEAVLILLHPC